VPWPLGVYRGPPEVYRGPPEVYRGPCMKITCLNCQLWFTHAAISSRHHCVTPSPRHPTLRRKLRGRQGVTGWRQCTLTAACVRFMFG